MMLSPGLRANTLLLPASLNLANAQDWKERLIAALTLTPILNLDGMSRHPASRSCLRPPNRQNRKAAKSF